MMNRQEEATPEREDIAAPHEYASGSQPSAEAIEPADIEPSGRRKWSLTENAFDHLLAALAPTPERAGEEYEKLRRKLVKFFAWEGCAFPEDLADETINRIAKRICDGETIQDLNSYCYGTARFVLLETRKEQQQKQRALDQMTPPQTKAEDNEAEEAALACLRQCLEKFAPETRQLIIEYYQGEKRARIENRQKLAAQLKIPPNALRNRILRLRDHLQACLDNCLGGRDRA